MQKNYLHIVFRQIIIWTAALALLTFFREVGTSQGEDVSWFNSLGWGERLLFQLFLGILSGFIFGTYEYFFDRHFTRRMPFGRTILLGTLGYVIIIFVFLASIFLAVNIIYDAGLGIKDFVRYLGRGGSVMIVFCLLMGLLIESVKQVDKKFGPGNLRRILLGKFYEPKEEERIFMFLDMRSSTTIAEKLGHIKYGQLVQDCFKDINAILPYQAEIYQYVGDEVILTWEKEKGLKNANCIHAYFAFTNKLAERKEYYLEKYGLLPEFKAGVNHGMVTATEVGEIKREIAYLGDVLNTAARIQSMCNEYGEDFLVAEKLVQKLSGDLGFETEAVGKVVLKGKEEEVGIYAINSKAI